MSAVWVRGQEGVMVRADSIITLACDVGGLDAECVTGRTVRLADSERPGGLLLALLDQIGRAGADERLAVVISPPRRARLAGLAPRVRAHLAGQADGR